MSDPTTDAAPSRSRLPAVLAILTVLALVALLASRALRTEGDGGPTAVAPPAADAPGAPGGAPAAPEGTGADDARPAALTGPGPAAGEPTGEAPAGRTASTGPEPGTRAPLVVTVVDAEGLPVEGARVALESVRAEANGMSYLVGPKERSSERTDADGEASIRYPVTVLDGGVTTLLAFTVEHPDFLPYRQTDLIAQAGRTTVTLERGAVVVVSGWIGSEETVVVAVEPTLSFRAQGARWQPLEDGRPAAVGIPPGRHALVLAHTAPDGTRYASALRTFVVADTERLELALELLPARTLEGRLSFDVPRPVANGRVVVGLQSGSRREAPQLLVRRSAAVAADGTFAVEGLPSLHGEIVAACDGWVSARVPTRDLARLGVTRAEDDVIAEAQRRLGDRALGLQELAAELDEGPLVLEMEPAGTLRLTVVDAEGEPVEGAEVQVRAAVRWQVGMADAWVGAVAATTDADGRASFVALPAGGHEVRVEREGYLPVRGRSGATATLESGIETELTVALESL